MDQRDAELRAGRIPKSFLPLQSGVGDVANSVLAALGESREIPDFEMYTEVLQDSVVPTTRYGHRQIAKFDRVGITWEPLPGAARYETGTFPNSLALCSYTSLQYIERLGLTNIRAHARQLTDRLQKELPAMGYPPVTPKGNETPIVAFQLKDAAATAKIG